VTITTQISMGTTAIFPEHTESDQYDQGAAKDEEGADAMKWKMVPVEPTEEMVRFGAYVIDDNGGNGLWSDIREAWAKMLAAAPPAPGCLDPLCPCQDGALCHYVDGPDGTMALPAPSATQYPLPDNMYDSKDWRAGSYAERVEWLHTMYENSQKTLDTYLAMRPSAELTVPAASVNWLLEQCEEYQRRAHEAEREVLALREALGVAKP
jgi:hypothetical protein